MKPMILATLAAAAIVFAGGVSVSADYCSIPKDVQDYLNSVLTPSIQALFSSCVLSGMAPSFHILSEADLLGLGTTFVPSTLYIDISRLSSPKIPSDSWERLRTWIRRGGRAAVYLTEVNTPLREFLQSMGIEASWPFAAKFDLSLAKRNCIVATPLLAGVSALGISSAGYVDGSKTTVTFAAVRGTERNAHHVYLGAVTYGNGMVIFSGIDNVFATPTIWRSALGRGSGDWTRFLLNFRTWMMQGSTEFYCPRCSRSVLPDWNYCPFCGYELP